MKKTKKFKENRPENYHVHDTGIMESAPQQVEKDIFVGSFEPPPLHLKMAGCRNGLLEDLVVLGNLPIAEVIIGDVRRVHQD